MAAFRTAHPDIIGLRLHEAVEHGIAGNAKDVIDAVRLAPGHRLLATVMAIAGW